MHIRVDTPEHDDPDLTQPLTFVEMCMARNPAAAGHLNEAHEKCARLRERYPGDPAILNLSGIVAMIGSNLEAAKRFWSEAVLARPGYEYALTPLTQALDEDEAWTDTETYLTALAEGVDHVADIYLRRARLYFADGFYEAADHLAQRASAIKKPGLSALHDYKACLTAARQSQTNGELTAWCQRVHDKYQTYWQTHDVTVAENWLTQDPPPDRLQLADLVTSVIEASSAETVNVLELGSFAGINLQLVRDALAADHKRRSRLFGLEPNAAAVDIGNTVLDGIRLLRGSHQNLQTGLPGLPEQFQVCMVSRVLMILTPDMVRDTLTSLRGRADTLIICDDIYNVDGDIPVVRTPPDFCIMHTFRHLLSEAGFDISAVIMADVPDRECTGFIIAQARDYSPSVR